MLLLTLKPLVKPSEVGVLVVLNQILEVDGEVGDEAVGTSGIISSITVVPPPKDCKSSVD